MKSRWLTPRVPQHRIRLHLVPSGVYQWQSKTRPLTVSASSVKVKKVKNLRYVGTEYPVTFQIALFAFLTATDLARCENGSGVSSTSPLRDGDSWLVRHVTPSTERGPPPDLQSVPIAVVPLPSGAMRQPSRPPPPPPPTTTTTTTAAPLPRPPQTPVVTQETTPSHAPSTHPTMPRPVLFVATSSDHPPVNDQLIHSKDCRNDDGSYTFA